MSDLAYHNTLMVQVWSALATGDARLAVQTLRTLPPKPADGTWLTYVRCHDDIGWAVDDDNAAALGLSGYLHRQFLADWYVGDFPGSWARGLTFQENPETHDRRTSGTAASLSGPQDRHGVDRLLLAHRRRGRLGRDPDRVERRRAGPAERSALGRRRGARRRQPLGAPSRTGLVTAPRSGTTRPRRPDGSSAVSPTWPGCARACPSCTVRSRARRWRAWPSRCWPCTREHASGPLVAIYNVSDSPVAFPLDRVRACGVGQAWDALGGAAVVADEHGEVTLPAYAAMWVVQAVARPRSDDDTA